MPAETPCDVVIIGGGPAGATAGRLLARAGYRVRLLDRTRLPRFKLGESALPRNFQLLGELGLDGRFNEVPWVDKRGAAFAFGDGEQTQVFHFSDALLGEGNQAFNVERSRFDAMLLDAAREAGVVVEEDRAIRKIIRLAEGDVAVEADGGEVITARLLLDASGQATFVAKHLGTRQTLPGFSKIAYYEHFLGVERLPGDLAGYPIIVMADEGWFWVIPIDERRTSIGLVMANDTAKAIGVPPTKMLDWGVARCPLMRRRMSGASGSASNRITADFTYRCTPSAGPGYLLLGDAATFIDPIFSTGLCLAMMGSAEAARASIAILGGARPGPVRRGYCRFLATSTAPFVRMIRLYYDHSFRELFLEGQGPFQVHKATLSVLAGAVFPRPVFALRWRLALLHFLVILNRYVHLVPKQRHFSLLAEPAASASPEPAAASSAGT